MPKDRNWVWPWEKDPNWVQSPVKENNAKGSTGSDDETEKSATAGAGDTKDPAKKPPQYTLSSAEIVVPDEGLKEGRPFRFKGKVRRLEGATASGAKISVQAVYRYKKEEQVCDNPVTVEINKDALDFEGKIDELFEPNAYNLDKEKPADAKYVLVLKFRGDCLDKDGFSKEVELPTESKSSTPKQVADDKAPLSSGKSYYQNAVDIYNGKNIQYAWGEASRTGADCSGLVCVATGQEKHIWNATGMPPGNWIAVNPSHSSKEDFVAELKEGDLLVWNGEHTAFYGGGSKLFHARKKGTIIGYTNDILLYWLSKDRIKEKGYPNVYRQKQ